MEYLFETNVKLNSITVDSSSWLRRVVTNTALLMFEHL